MAIIIKIIAKPYTRATHTTNPTIMWQYGHIVELAIFFFNIINIQITDVSIVWQMVCELNWLMVDGI